MKAVILAGGLGTRLSEETEHRPKPMVEIGGKPILWHIMKIYSAHGIDEFIICLGYKGYVIKEWFANYFLHNSDVTIDMRDNSMSIHQASVEPWRVTLIDTGEATMIGGRIKRILPFVARRSGVLPHLWRRRRRCRHLRRRSHCIATSGRLATVTATQPPGRFGVVAARRQSRHRLSGKADRRRGVDQWRLFVLSPKVERLYRRRCVGWEREPMERLAADDQLTVYFHHGFWQPMDTLRDKRYLEELWAGGQAPWKVW